MTIERVDATLRNVIGLSVSVFTETTTSTTVNFIQGHSISTSIEDAILDIDSTADQAVDQTGVLPTATDESEFSVGTLPTRYKEGRLQRVRALRSRLLASDGAISELQKILASGAF
jgi:hypothetical protein